ncbi:MAG TPA: TetR/AcrR family transcriptional regulator [Anaerolineae bacterium]|nr:TetR/AcrR family transcriptional regulator [Anaerolineae bacterium]
MTHDGSGKGSILATSAKLFGEKGYKGVSIRDIAQACGLTNAALYYHFKNKDDLYLAVLQDAHERAVATLDEAARSGGSVRSRLKQLVDRYFEVMLAQRQSFQMLWRDLKNVDDVRASKLYADMRAGFMRPIRETIEAAQAKGEMVGGDAQLYARLLHGMMIALTFEGRQNSKARVTSDQVDALVKVFLEGVGKK